MSESLDTDNLEIKSMYRDVVESADSGIPIRTCGFQWLFDRRFRREQSVSTDHVY